MQVILVQDVPHLGLLGDQVQVKNGYARNYLLPRGMAIVATSKRTGQIEHRRKHLDQLRQEAIGKAQAEIDKVAALELRVQAKAGVNGKLFGSVTNRDIQAVLAEQGYEVDRRAIQLHTLIKSVGNFTATVKLHTDVKVDVSIKVEALGDQEAVAVTEGEEGDAAAGDVTADESTTAVGDDLQAEAGETAPNEAQTADADESAGDAPTAGESTAAAPTANEDADGTPDNDQPGGDMPGNDIPENPSDGGSEDDNAKDASGEQN